MCAIGNSMSCGAGISHSFVYNVEVKAAGMTGNSPCSFRRMRVTGAHDAHAHYAVVLATGYLGCGEGCDILSSAGWR
jgi:hypothetical protein